MFLYSFNPFLPERVIFSGRAEWKIQDGETLRSTLSHPVQSIDKNTISEATFKHEG
jgi:hypothetical protein